MSDSSIVLKVEILTRDDGNAAEESNRKGSASSDFEISRCFERKEVLLTFRSLEERGTGEEYISCSFQ